VNESEGEPVLDSTPEKLGYMNQMSELACLRPFMTEKGFVGLGPEEMRKDDIVVIFEGEKFVYVLRKEEVKNM
jgi:hypothetical protein